MPEELYEAAPIDGASGWQTFLARHLADADAGDAGGAGVPLHLRLPAVLRGLAADPGGPARLTEVLAIYLYRHAFRYNEFGLASAIGWLMVVRLGADRQLLSAADVPADAREQADCVSSLPPASAARVGFPLVARLVGASRSC